MRWPINAGTSILKLVVVTRKPVVAFALRFAGKEVIDESPETRLEVVVECSDEGRQREVFDRLSGEGLTCRVLTF
jgi:hypothetical protein